MGLNLKTSTIYAQQLSTTATAGITPLTAPNTIARTCPLAATGKVVCNSQSFTTNATVYQLKVNYTSCIPYVASVGTTTMNPTWDEIGKSAVIDTTVSKDTEISLVDDSVTGKVNSGSVDTEAGTIEAELQFDYSYTTTLEEGPLDVVISVTTTA